MTTEKTLNPIELLKHAMASGNIDDVFRLTPEAKKFKATEDAALWDRTAKEREQLTVKVMSQFKKLAVTFEPEIAKLVGEDKVEINFHFVNANDVSCGIMKTPKASKSNGARAAGEKYPVSTKDLVEKYPENKAEYERVLAIPKAEKSERGNELYQLRLKLIEQDKANGK